ncbi:MAG: hypothetical protein SF029_07940 [bacterium]|nr:hypothetical protein [bacterium]
MLAVLIVVALATMSLRLEAQTNAVPFDGYLRASRLGITHISGPGQTDSLRYQTALALGAGWNRWPLYWEQVQPQPDQWTWEAYDRLVAADLTHGLQINAILIGRPAFYADEETQMTGLYAPIFDDGSDIPEAGKGFNPANPWAHYVYNAVARYRPGGSFTAGLNLGANAGVRVWEVWNEPDFRQFWQGSIEDYARLLKVAYIAAKHADPQTQIMFGGLLYPNGGVNWLAQVLRLYSRDPLAERFNYFMDRVAVHSYGDPWRSGWLIQVARDSLTAYGLERPVWLNESGVPIWDDYPGPTWAADSRGYATIQQQAHYLIQSTAFAYARGAEVVFYHQLYDDCGDQPAGTDFAPNSQLYGDSFGLLRNLPNYACFRQHPQPGTPRPSANAYRLLAELFGTTPFTPLDRVSADGRVWVLTFQRPERDERLTLVWNTTFDPLTFELPAAGQNAQILTLNDSFASPRLIDAQDGVYRLQLPPAQPDNIPNPPPGQDAAIGGAPFILIERPGGQMPSNAIALEPTVTPPAPIPAPPTPESALSPPAAPSVEQTISTPFLTVTASVPTAAPPLPTPTFDIAQDITPPQASISPLPPTSPAQFTVAWGGIDDTGIAAFVIWVRVNGGDWTVWLNIDRADQRSATYIGVPGSLYEFAAWAVDLNGNWSLNIQLEPQAATRVE